MMYQLMEPPFPFKSFYDLKPLEAKTLFEWFMEQIPERVTLLKMAFEVTSGTSQDALDLSPQSLTISWDWFRTQLQQEEKSQAELENEYNNIPIRYKGLIDVEEKRLSLGTLALAQDVAIYFAETLIAEFPSVHWGIVTRPKNFVDVNQPVLTGFESDLVKNPTRMVRVLAQRTIHGTAPNDSLRAMHDRWASEIQL